MATSITVAVIGGTGVGAALGKKGTESDLALFNHVREGHAATIVEPIQYPEKFPPLLVALAMAEHVVLVVSQLDRGFAEAAATLDLLDVPVALRRSPGVGEEEVRRALRGSRLETLPLEPLDLVRLREEVDSWSTPSRDGPLRLPLDHAFPVKGIGAVGLGFVRQGTARTHDRLTLYPTGRQVEIRSIQVHDVDVEEARVGERVGVALRGVDPEELARGQLLAPATGIEVSERLHGSPFIRCRYYRGDLRAGAQIHVQVGLQVVPTQLEGLDEGSIVLACDRPVAWESGQRAIIADLSAPTGPRVAGGCVLSDPPSRESS